MTRKKKLLLGGLLAFVALMVGLVIVGVLAAKPLAKSIVVHGARAHGVLVEPDFVDVGWGWVRLRDAKFELEGVAGIHATVGRATVDLDGLTPSRVEMRGLNVQLTGSAADFVLDLGTWAKRHPDAVKFPVAADDVRVSWSTKGSEPAWLTLEGGLVAPRSGGLFEGARFMAQRATVLGVSVGPIGAAWGSDNAAVTFGFGDANPSAALVRMDVERATGKASLHLKPVKLSALAKPLDLRLPIDGNVVLEGDAELSLTPNEALEVEGTLHAKLDGYVPPHPKELDGIVFGKVTSFETHLRLSTDRQKIYLDNARVAAGAFRLDGGGLIERRPDHGLVTLDMAGNIPCSLLGKSAAVANIGGPLGQFLGDTAKKVLAGSVRVGVKIVADSRRLDEAEVRNSVSVGCTLKF